MWGSTIFPAQEKQCTQERIAGGILRSQSRGCPKLNIAGSENSIYGTKKKKNRITPGELTKEVTTSVGIRAFFSKSEISITALHRSLRGLEVCGYISG